MSTHSTSARDNRSPTRRRVLIAGTAAVAAVAAPARAALAAAAALNDIDRRVIALWAQRAQLIAVWADAHAGENAARQQLPPWMNPGPRHLYADGSFGEEQSGWPAIPDAKPPAAGRITIRPDEDELWGLYQASRTLGLETARPDYDRARAGLRARVDATDREYVRLGLTEFAERAERTHRAITAIEEEISDLDCEESLHAAAAGTLLLAREVLRADADEFAPQPGVGLFVAMLRLLRPAIDGPIAEDLDHVLVAADTYEDGAILAALDPRFA